MSGLRFQAWWPVAPAGFPPRERSPNSPPAGAPSILARVHLCRLRVAREQRILRGHEQEGERHDAEHLEGEPSVGRLRPPYDLVEHREREEEQRPAPGQLAPTFRREIEHRIEHQREQRLAEREAAQQHGAEQQIDDGRLELDEHVVLQHQREAAEHHDDEGGDDGHDRHAVQQPVGRRERDYDRDHENAGGGENAPARVGEEEQDQRPQLEGELEKRIDGRLLVHEVSSRTGAVQLSSPAMARAKSRAANGCRSSIPSPTPMKCTGTPKRSAMATRIPPRAVPSSLVMTRPVTPAVRRNSSTCDNAFWPTVASSTSSTACGAAGSSFFITRTTFSNSPMRAALFCKRPAVSTISTSVAAARAADSASNTRPAESAPGSRATTGAPVRSPQILS